jgi:hypothetical protein
MDTTPEENQCIANFTEITGADPATAMSYLKSHDWVVEDAMNTFFASGGAAIPASDGHSSMDADAALAASMAVQDDDIRAPIEAVEGRLLDDIGMDFMNQPGMGAPPRHAFTGRRPQSVDAFRDYGAEDAEMTQEEESTSSSRQHAKKLADLFAPPTKISFLGTFEQACEQAKEEKRFMIVNIQNTTEFASHMLNRDTWSKEEVQDVIQENFIFWQQDSQTEEGGRYCSFYGCDPLPSVDVIDPRTGQRVLELHEFVDAATMLEKLVPFMGGDSWDSVPPPPKRIAGSRSREPSNAAPVPELTEEEMLEAAIAASLGSSGDADMEHLMERRRDAAVNGASAVDYGSSSAASTGPKSADQLLREKQEQEYQESLMMDQQKERQRRESEEDELLAAAMKKSEEEAEEAAKRAVEEAKQAALAMVPTEPAPSDAGVTTIAFRMTDGSRIQRRFIESNQIKHLIAFIEAEGTNMDELQLMTNFPKKIYSDPEQTLKDAGLCPDGMLIVARK